MSKKEGDGLASLKSQLLESEVESPPKDTTPIKKDTRVEKKLGESRLRFIVDEQRRMIRYLKRELDYYKSKSADHDWRKDVQ